MLELKELKALNWFQGYLGLKLIENKIIKKNTKEKIMGVGKPRGIRAGRKLTRHRKD